MSRRRKPNSGRPARTHAPPAERMVVRDRATALGESARTAARSSLERDRLREEYLAGLDRQMDEVGQLDPIPAASSMTVNSVVPVSPIAGDPGAVSVGPLAYGQQVGPGDLTITVDDDAAERRRRRAVEEYLAGGGGPGAAGQGMRA